MSLVRSRNSYIVACHRATMIKQSYLLTDWEITNMILIQDVNNPHNSTGNETLIFSVPIPVKTWEFWYKQADKDKSFEGESFDTGMAYVMVKPEDEAGTMVLLPREGQDDDTAVYFAARIRLGQNFTGKIFVVRGTWTPWTRAQVQYAILGGDPRRMLQVEDPES